MQDVKLLDELSDDEMVRVAASAATKRYLRGDLIFGEDDEPDRLCVVASGRIAIAKKSIDGRESMVALMERGVYVNFARPPATPTGTYLLRCSLCAEHTPEQIAEILRQFDAAAAAVGLRLPAAA